MKKILLLVVLIFGAQSFADEKKYGEIKRPRCGMLGEFNDDERCKPDGFSEYGSNRDLNCSKILEHSRCTVIPTDSQAFDICCRIPAQGKITNCKMTPDKYMLFCKDASSGKELVYTLISNEMFIPIKSSSFPSRKMDKKVEEEERPLNRPISDDRKFDRYK